MTDDGPRAEISDWELWACAQQLLTQHGDRASAHIAKRIGALALAGDMDGVATWKRIADRLDQLTDHGATGQRTQH